MFKDSFNYFSRTEKLLWLISAAGIAAAFFIFDGADVLTLAASLIGVTSLIFCAKGNPLGQALMIVFSLLYGAISYTFAYYGEMITYLGMTLPMAVVSLVAWLRHPFRGRRAEVEVRRIGKGELLLLVGLTLAVTVVFYFVLRAVKTANLFPSTVSVATSFLAAALTFRRSPAFALAYAANDVVLILLWILAALEDPAYVSVAICFAAFLANDVYGYISWKRMALRQREQSEQEPLGKSPGSV